MSSFEPKELLEWRKHVQELKDGLKKLDLKLKEDLDRKAKERTEALKEFVDPKALNKRHEQLLLVKESLKKLANVSAFVQLEVMQPIIPGRQLLVHPEDQSAVAHFCPSAYKTLSKTTQAVSGLKLLESASSITETMDQSVLTMMHANRQMASRLQKLREERRLLDSAPAGLGLRKEQVDAERSHDCPCQES